MGKLFSHFRFPASEQQEYQLRSRLFICLLFLLTLFTFSDLYAQSVSVDNVSRLSGGQDTTYTFSHTVGSGSNRMLIVGVSLLDTGTGKEVGSVTYGGTSMTQITNLTGSGIRIQIFRLMAPAEGTANIVVDIEGISANKAALGAISYFGVDQGTPTENQTSLSSEGTSSSISVTSETDDLVMDIVGTDKAIADTAAGPGQTRRWTAAAESGKETSSSTESGASSVTMDWNFSTTRKINHIGFNINATSDTTAPTISNVALGASAGNLTFSFDSDEQLGSSSTDIAVSVDGPNTTDVYSFNRNDFSETDNGSFYTYTLTATQAYDDGEGTYTGAVNDALDSSGNDGADGTQTDTYDYDTSSNTWESSTGASPNDWLEAANWSVGTPTSSQVITIPTNPQNNADEFPVIQSQDTVTSLQIKSGGTVNVDTSFAITVTDSVEGAGKLLIDNAEATIGGNISVDSVKAGDSKITLNGSSEQKITGSIITADTLTITNTSGDGITLSDSLTTNSLLDVNKGSSTLSLQSGSAVNTHDIAGSGSITSSSASFYISGDVTVSSLGASRSDVTFNGTSESQTVNNITEYQNLTVNNTHTSDRVIAKSNVIVNNALTLENGDLIMSSGTNLITSSRSLSGGTLRFQIELSSKGWYNLSSPVSSTYKDFLDSIVTQGYAGATYESDTLQPNVLYYKETVGGTDNQHWRAIDTASTSITEARGHFVHVFGDVANDTLYERATPRTLEVGGTEFNGDGTSVSFDVTYTDTTTSDSVESQRGWNLVGNPFGASINWNDETQWTKTNIDSVIYVWDQGSNDYLTWNGVDGTFGDSLIAPFQGFWVKANGSNPALSVDNTAKTTGGEFRGKTSLEPASIKFKLESGELSEIMHLTLSAIGKYSKDPRDAYRLLPFDTQTYLAFYTTLENGSQLTINNLPRRFGTKISIPIYVGGFKNGSPLNGNYTLSWPDFGNIPEEWAITLEDHKTGKKINIRKNTFYSFHLSQSKKKKAATQSIRNYQLTRNPKVGKTKRSVENRLSLHIDPGREIANIPQKYVLKGNYPNPFQNQTSMKFATPKKGPVEIMIYDILGRKVRTLIDKTLPAAHHEIPWNPSRLASGVYICVMRAGDKQFSKKITYIK